MGGIAYVQKHEYEAMKAEITRLRAQRDQLLAALQKALMFVDRYEHPMTWDELHRAALAAVEEKP